MRISDWSSDVCSSDLRDRLALPAGQVLAALADGHVEAGGMPAGEFLDAGDAGGPQDHRVVGEGSADADVLLNGTEEQVYVLRHHADVAAQVRGIDLPQDRKSTRLNSRH